MSYTITEKNGITYRTILKDRVPYAPDLGVRCSHTMTIGTGRRFQGKRNQHTKANYRVGKQKKACPRMATILIDNTPYCSAHAPGEPD